MRLESYRLLTDFKRFRHWMSFIGAVERLASFHKEIEMKKIVTLALLSLPVAYASSDANEKAVLRDPVYRGLIAGVQRKYKAKCEPQMDNIQWRCLNGPTCGYTLETLCLGPHNIGGARVEVSGM